MTDRHPADSDNLPEDAFASQLEAIDEAVAAGRNSPPVADPELAQAQDVLQLIDQVRRQPGAGSDRSSVGNEFDQTVNVPAGADQTAGNISSPRQPDSIGGYEILGVIARGGMGIVFRARQPGLDRIVALKMMLAGPFAYEEERQRFKVEAESAARLDHPGIVPIYEIGEHQGQPYFTMAFVEGESLAAGIQREPLEPREAAELTRKICDAVAYAHDRGVVHRDIKPLNVLIDQTGQPRITDFGLARRTDSNSELTGTGQVLGTPSYMAPEQASGSPAGAGPAADIHAIGATLYCMLTGHPPFQAASAIDTLKLVIEQEPLSPRQLNPTIPIDLATICLKCLHKEPHRRYDTAADLGDDLKRFLKREPIRARPVRSFERFLKWSRRHPLVAGLSGTITIALVALIVGGIWYQSQLTSALKDGRISEAKTIDTLYASYTSEAEFLNRGRPPGYGARVWRLLDQARQLKTPKVDPIQLRQLAIDSLGHVASSEPYTFEKLGSKILSADVTPDGRFVLAGLQNGQIVVLDGQTHREVQRLDASQEAVTKIQLIGSDRLMAYGPFCRTLTFWQRDSRDRWSLVKRHTFEVRDKHFPVKPSPDGRFLIGWTPVPAASVTKQEWDSYFNLPDTFLADVGSPVHFFVQPIESFSDVPVPKATDASSIPDVPFGSRFDVADNYLVVSHFIDEPFTNTLFVVNLVTQEVEREIHTDCGSMAGHVPVISRDGRYVGCSGHVGAQIFDRETGVELARIDDEGVCSTLSFIGADGDLLFSNITGHSEYIWYSLKKHRAIARFPYERNQVRLQVSSAGRHALWVGTDTLHVSDFYGSERLEIPAHTEVTGNIQFSPDGRFVASRGHAGQIRLWSQRGELLHEVPGGRFAFSPDGRFFVMQSDQLLTFWSVADGRRIGHVDCEFAAEGILFNASGDLLAANNSDRGLVVWQFTPSAQPDRTNGSEGNPSRNPAARRVFEFESERIWCPIWSPSGRKLAFYRVADNTVTIHDFDRTQDDFVLMTSSGIRIKALAFVSEDRLAVIDAGRIGLWDLKTRKRLSLGPLGALWPLAVSPDRRFLVQGSRIHRTDDLDDFVELPVWNSTVFSSAWSPDGRTLALGFVQGSLVIWNLEAVHTRLAALGYEFPAHSFREIEPIESVTSLLEQFRRLPADDPAPLWQTAYEKALSMASSGEPLPKTLGARLDWLLRNMETPTPGKPFFNEVTPRPDERVTQLNDLIYSLMKRGESRLAEVVARKVIGYCTAVKDVDDDLLLGQSQTYHYLGDLYNFQLKPKRSKAVTAYRAEQAIMKRVLKDPGRSGKPGLLSRWLWSNHNLALALNAGGDRTAAIEHMDTALAIYERDPKKRGQADLSKSFQRLIDWLKAANRIEEAAAVLDRAQKAKSLNNPSPSALPKPPSN